MSPRTAGRWDSGEAWSQARERARKEVQEAFAPRHRVCAECGHEATTASATCPACGAPYVSRREAGMSRSARRRLALGALAALIVLGVVAALVVPGLESSKRAENAKEKA